MSNLRERLDIICGQLLCGELEHEICESFARIDEYFGDIIEEDDREHEWTKRFKSKVHDIVGKGKEALGRGKEKLGDVKDKIRSRLPRAEDIPAHERMEQMRWLINDLDQYYPRAGEGLKKAVLLARAGVTNKDRAPEILRRFQTWADQVLIPSLAQREEQMDAEARTAREFASRVREILGI